MVSYSQEYKSLGTVVASQQHLTSRFQSKTDHPNPVAEYFFNPYRRMSRDQLDAIRALIPSLLTEDRQEAYQLLQGFRRTWYNWLWNQEEIESMLEEVEPCEERVRRQKEILDLYIKRRLVEEWMRLERTHPGQYNFGASGGNACLSEY